MFIAIFASLTLLLDRGARVAAAPSRQSGDCINTQIGSRTNVFPSDFHIIGNEASGRGGQAQVRDQVLLTNQHLQWNRCDQMSHPSSLLCRSLMPRILLLRIMTPTRYRWLHQTRLPSTMRFW